MITYPTEAGQEKAALPAKAFLQLSGVGKKYPLRGANACGDFWALKDINLEVKEKEMVGIIGRNGAGKTSLLNIISGTLSPTEGSVIRKGKVLGLFSLGVGFQDELTGRENIFLNGAILGAGKKELNDKVNSIIEFSELGDFIDMPLGSYSQGMRLRLGFSIVTALDFDILVIDEILAVGDALFQNKCFQRLLDFKRQGKTLVITSQSMDLVERLCDKAALIDHGRLLFYGGPEEGIGKYKLLMNTEKFSVGPANKSTDLVTDTKKWADNISEWGNKLGTKEIAIDSVDLVNKFGMRCGKIKSGSCLKIKVRFSVKSEVKDLHFGVAIFRKDGVYCYGPNTAFDGHKIPTAKKGNGWFSLEYRSMLLAAGEYYVSVAIWDKRETLAFDYHDGCYELIVKGDGNANNGLLSLPFKSFLRKSKTAPDLKILEDKWGEKINAGDIDIESIELLNSLGEAKVAFMTNEAVKFRINLNGHRPGVRSLYLWLGIYRDDRVYCQGITAYLGKENILTIALPGFALLPGRYRFSIGIWDQAQQRFLACHHGVYAFGMVFDRKDHGTVYLEHKWQWRLPR